MIMGLKDLIIGIVALTIAILIVEGLLLVIFVAWKIMTTITVIVITLIVAFVIYDVIRSRG